MSDEELARNVALAIGLVLIVAVLLSLPVLRRMGREVDPPTRKGVWRTATLAFGLFVMFQLVDWLAG